jgi:phage/plasmid-like protein (TIGR03299 family)
MSNVISLVTRNTKPAHATNKIYSGGRASFSDLYGKTATQVKQGESLESAMNRAGVLFEAEKALEKWEHNGEIITGDQYIIKRSDNGQKLGNVTDRYKAVQPYDIVSAWSRLVDSEGWSLKTIGNIDGGKRVWALAETNRQFHVGDSKIGDAISTQLLLSTSFDGTSSSLAKIMIYRLVCLNGLILPNIDRQIKVPHSADFDINEVARQLEVAAIVHDQANESAQRMAAQRISDEQAAELITKVLDPKGYEKGDVSTKQKNIIADVLKLYGGGGYGATMESAQGTVWGALNALTQHCDHNVGRTDNNRIREAYFGKTCKVKQNAYNLALELCA